MLATIWERISDEIKPARRVEVLAGLMEDFAIEDCDTLAELSQEKGDDADLAYRLYWKNTSGEEYPNE